MTRFVKSSPSWASSALCEPVGVWVAEGLVARWTSFAKTIPVVRSLLRTNWRRQTTINLGAVTAAWVTPEPAAQHRDRLRTGTLIGMTPRIVIGLTRNPFAANLKNLWHAHELANCSLVICSFEPTARLAR